MIAELVSFAFGAVAGVVIGAMILDAHHERQRAALEANAADTAAELIAMRELYARSEAMVDAMSRECAYLKSQRSQAESLHAERIRNAIGAARWN